MRKFKINDFCECPGGYYVVLGNNLKYQFASKRKINLFLSGVNDFLTSTLVETNNIYSELYNSYRREYWPYLRHPGARFPVFQQEITVNQCFDVISKLLDISIDRSALPSGASYSFIRLHKILKYLQEIVFVLKSISLRKRSDPYRVRSLVIILKRLYAIDNDLDCYKIELAAGSPQPEAKEIKLSNIA